MGKTKKKKNMKLLIVALLAFFCVVALASDSESSQSSSADSDALLKSSETEQSSSQQSEESEQSELESEQSADSQSEVEDEDAANETCFKDGKQGVCIDYRTCTGKSHRGLCPGNWKIRCCVSSSASTNDDEDGSGSCQLNKASFTKARFEKMWSAYPRGKSDDVKKQIGGYVNRGWITNTCAIRLSRTFNYAGCKAFRIPKNKSFGGRKLNTVGGGDYMRYAYRVSEMRRFLRAKLGSPDVVWKNPNKARRQYDNEGINAPDAFRNERGIILFDVSIWNDATGHLDLWKQRECAGKCYFPESKEVLLWRAV